MTAEECGSLESAGGLLERLERDAAFGEVDALRTRRDRRVESQLEDWLNGFPVDRDHLDRTRISGPIPGSGPTPGTVSELRP